MTKTKEYNEAVEKLEKVLASIYIDKTKYIVPCVEGVPVTRWQAKAILDALNIEVVSREVFRLNDLITEGMGAKTCSKIDPDTQEPYYIIGGIYKAYSSSREIIRRNNKPAVYVENIGGKDE